MGKPRTDPLTGLRESVNVDRNVILALQAQGCTIFDVRTFAYLAGRKDVRYFVEYTLVQESMDTIHRYPVRDVTGKIVTYATCSNSAEQGGKNLDYQTMLKRQHKLISITDV